MAIRSNRHQGSLQDQTPAECPSSKS